MADKKISQLTAASTPLAGTEVLPIVQSSATVKVSVANLTAGRAVSTGALTASVTDTSFIGDFQQSTAGNTGEVRVYNSDNTSASSNARLRLQVGGTSAGDACLYFYDGVNTSFGPDNSDSHNIKLTTGTTPSGGTTLLSTNRTTGDHTISTGNLVQGTAAKGLTTGGAFSLGLGTNGSTSQATIDTSGNLSVTGKVSVSNTFESTSYVAINSSTATTVASGISFLAIMRCRGSGGSAVVLYENNTTPVIIAQTGSVTFTTSAPTANQIQIADGGSSITALSGSSVGSNNLNITIIKNQ